MAVLRLFASAREAAGLSVDRIDAETVAGVLDEARRRYGAHFAGVLEHSRIWVNGQPAEPGTAVREADVVAILPPVSGGAESLAQSFFVTEPSLEAPPLLDEPLWGVDPVAGDEPALPPPPPPPPSPQAPPPPVPIDKPRPAATAAEMAWFRPPEITPVEGALAQAPKPAPIPTPVPAPSASPEAAAEPAAPRPAPAVRPSLAVVPGTDRPHVRLGLLWALLTVVAAIGGRPTLALWMAGAAAIAAIQVTRVWLARGERPVSYLAVAGAAALPLGAIDGLGTMNILVLLTFASALLVRVRTVTKAPSRDVALTLLIAVPIGLAAASPVLLRGLGLAVPLALFAFAAFHDVGAYLVGTGAVATWEGPVAGVASVVCVSLFVAVLVPSLSGASPFLLGLLAGALAPLGPLAASAILGDRSADAPALRRLDSLLLLGPIWALSAAALIKR